MAMGKQKFECTLEHIKYQVNNKMEELSHLKKKCIYQTNNNSILININNVM